MSLFDDRLNAALIRLYEVFAPYQNLSQAFAQCSWLTEQARSVLKTKPVRMLSTDDLADYLSHTDFCGTEADFRHFLPRLAELLFSGALPLPPQFYILNLDLPLGEERAVIDAVVDAFWEKFLRTSPFRFGPDELLCSFALIYSDLSPFLTVWDKTESLDALRHLAALSEDATYCSDWVHRPEQMNQLVRWLQTPQTIGRLEAAASVYGDDLSDAAQRLRHWKALK